MVCSRCMLEFCRGATSQKSENGNLVDTGGELGASAWNSSPHTWVLGQGNAAVVHFGLFEVVGGINKVHPSVFHDDEKNSLCIFQGYLSNLDELMYKYMDSGFDSRSSSPTAVVMPKKTAGEKAAEVVFLMFSQGEDPLILLSELQGQYAFAMYDGDKRQAFAARDSSGREPLFFEIDDDGGLSISNERLLVTSADGMGFVTWDQLPPGHYVCGKPVKMHQFALTPAQLSEREYIDAMDDDRSHHSSRRSPSGDNIASSLDAL